MAKIVIPVSFHSRFIKSVCPTLSISPSVSHKQVFVYFRSWDLWGGLPANLAGIQQLKEYMAGQIGVDDGEMIVESKGLHLYGYAEELAKLRCLSFAPFIQSYKRK